MSDNKKYHYNKNQNYCKTQVNNANKYLRRNEDLIEALIDNENLGHHKTNGNSFLNKRHRDGQEGKYNFILVNSINKNRKNSLMVRINQNNINLKFLKKCFRINLKYIEQIFK